MADKIPMEETDAYKAGMRDQRVKAIENAFAKHEERCQNHYDNLYKETKRHTWFIGIGFGIVGVLQVLALAFGSVLTS